MSRFIPVILVLAMVFCLCACTQQSEATEPSTTTEPIIVPTTTMPAEKDPQLGDFADGVYTNAFIGIRCEVGEEWTVYSDAQLAQLNGLLLDAMTDADLVEQLKKANIAHLFYASKQNGLATMNVVLENLGTVNGILLDEKGYAELSVKQIPAALEDLGLDNVTAEITSALFASDRHTVIKVHGLSNGVPFYERIVCIKVGSYIGLVTVASYETDATSDLLNMFKKS